MTMTMMMILMLIFMLMVTIMIMMTRLLIRKLGGEGSVRVRAGCWRLIACFDKEFNKERYNSDTSTSLRYNLLN